MTRQTSPRLELGGGTTLHDLLELMEQLADQQPSSYHYGKQFGIHLRKVNSYTTFYFLVLPFTNFISIYLDIYIDVHEWNM